MMYCFLKATVVVGSVIGWTLVFAILLKKADEGK